MKKWALLLAGLGSLGVAASISWITAIPRSLASVATEGDAKPRATALIKKVERKALFDDLSYPARIESRVNTTILAESDGYVSHLYSPLGSPVARHERLLQITTTDPVYQYAPVVVRSPVRGVVSQVDVTEGTQVVKGQKLGSITDPTSVRIVVEVPSLDLQALSRGMKGEFRLEGSDAAIPIEVSGISPFVDPATGTATCMLEPKGADHPLLRPGVLGQVSFRTNERLGIAIPEHAIIYRRADPFVRVVESGRARKVAVKLGRRQQGLVEILSGLQDGQALIERLSRFVADGESVDPEAPETGGT